MNVKANVEQTFETLKNKIYARVLIVVLPFPSERITPKEIGLRTLLKDADPRVEKTASAINLSKSPSVVLEFAKDAYSREEERLKAVQEKSKNLLTTCAVLIPLLAALSPKFARFWWLPLLGIVPVFYATFVLFISSGIGRRFIPDLASSDPPLEEGNEQKSLALSYFDSSVQNSSNTDFLVTIYRGARRAFGIGLTLFVFLVAFSLMRESQPPTPIVVLPAPITITPSPLIPAPAVTVNAATQPAPTVNVIAPATQKAGSVQVLIEGNSLIRFSPSTHPATSPSSNCGNELRIDK